jgi:hypothetical protein
MSGLFGGGTIKGNRITDFAQTTATVGTVIPFGYGRFACDGNVIYADLPPTESVSTRKQGKGGIKQQTYHYALSYAVAFCKGPIYGFLWIKRNGKVVYTSDPNAPVEDLAYATKWLQKATLYTGTPDQMPDSTIEAAVGTGKVSGFHNIAYIVLEQDDVTDGGGAVPSYEAAVIATPPEVYITSRPYPIEVMDGMGIYGEPIKLHNATQPTVMDAMAGTGAPLNIDLYGGAKTYTDGLPDYLSITGEPVNIDLYGGAKSYTAIPDYLAIAGAPVNIDLFGGAQAYVIPPEWLSISGAPLSITLETV